MATQVETFQELGVVLSVAGDVTLYTGDGISPVKPGDKVYFDSWMAAKFPKEGTLNEFFWCVKWEDVRAIIHVEQPISE